MSVFGLRSARRAALALSIAAILLNACDSEGGPASEPSGGEPDATVEIDPEHRAHVAALAQDWPEEPSYPVSFNALDPAAALTEEARPSPFDPNDPHWGLPDDRGRDLVEAYCGACHSLRLVMQQSMVESGWDGTLTRMVSDRGMPPIPPDVRVSIMTYLTAHFGAEG